MNTPKDKGDMPQPEFDERWLQSGGIVLVGPETTGILIREIQRLRKLLPSFSEFIRNATPEAKDFIYRDVLKRATERQNAALQVSPANPLVGEGESTTADREPAAAAPFSSVEDGPFTGSEQEPQRPAWWNRPLHPRYGPCDGFVDGTCSECRRVIWEKTRQLTESWKRERCFAEALDDANRLIDEWAQDR